VQLSAEIGVQYSVDSRLVPAGQAQGRNEPEQEGSKGEPGRYLGEGVFAVPLYLHCPHCEHPQIVPVRRRGRAQFCRQCGRAYVPSKTREEAHPLPISTLAEMQEYSRPADPRVFVLD